MINLINSDIKDQRILNQKLRLIIVFFSSLICLSAICWVSVLIMENLHSTRIAKIEEETQAIQSKTLKYRELEKDINFTNDRIKQINSVISGRIQWSQIIASFSSLTPNSIKIVSLSISTTPVSTNDKNKTKKPLGQINVSGVARTLDDIEIFRKSLDNSGIFGSSVFKSASLNKEENTFNFTLTTGVISNKTKVNETSTKN